MIQIKVKVTKDILRESMMCGTNAKLKTKNCAVALAIKEIFPFASVGVFEYYPVSTKTTYARHDGGTFIKMFDLSTPAERLLLPETEITLDITDEILEAIDLPEIAAKVETIDHLELVGV